MKKIKDYVMLFMNKIATGIMYNLHSLDLGKNVVFKKCPSILKHKDAKITIGSNTTINSSNYGYHINMHSGCKLYADRPRAIITIGRNCRIHGTCIHAYAKISIGDNCLIAANTQIIDGNGHQLSFDNPANRVNTTDMGKEIIIEDNVWIAANCIILGGTVIGSGAIITAGSIVKGLIPNNSLYGGNPAKLIKQY